MKGRCFNICMARLSYGRPSRPSFEKAIGSGSRARRETGDAQKADAADKAGDAASASIRDERTKEGELVLDLAKLC